MMDTSDSLDIENDHFEYTTHCLICASVIDERRKYDRGHEYSKVSYLSSDTKKCVVSEKLLELCVNRSDETSRNVKARIDFAGDVVEAGAVYHRRCYRELLHKDNGRQNNQSSNLGNFDTLNNDAFDQILQWLNEPMQYGKQFTLNELREKLKTYLPGDVPAFSFRHLKRRLSEYYGHNICFADNNGVSTIVSFKDTASKILRSAYIDACGDSSKNNATCASDVGKVIRNEIQKIDSSSQHYPCPSDISIPNLEKDIPETLFSLLKSITCFSARSVSSRSKKDLLAIAIAHVIMGAVAKVGYMSPLLLATGLLLFKETRSRCLIDTFAALGFCASYSEILKFQKAAATTRNNDETILTQNFDGFCQWVADNFDLNEDTVDGHNTTHSMGIITCARPSPNSEPITKEHVIVPKRKCQESSMLGSFGSMIKVFKRPSSTLLDDVKIKPVCLPKIPVFAFELLDTLWSTSAFLMSSMPEWQGFMSQFEKSTSLLECTSIFYNPMVPLSPNSDDAVYSTLSFVMSEANRAKLCCASVTFDQPLYLRAYRIKVDSGDQFKHLFIRLGGFHQLMSFMGACGKLMENCGLEDLWSTVYSSKSVSRMVQGKAYARALRALLLTDAALHAILHRILNGNEEFPGHPENEECLPNADETGGSDSESDFGAGNVETPSCLQTCHEEEGHISQKSEKQTCESSTSFAAQCDENLKHTSKLIGKIKSAADNIEPVILQDEFLVKKHSEITVLKAKLSTNRTSKLWLMLVQIVSIIKMFIRAERTDNWNLHVKATKDMLPVFAASGHSNYAKCCRLYLQNIESGCDCIKRKLQAGLFSVRRNSQLFWSGNWTDLTIEQTMMRHCKRRGGLVNITKREGSKTLWLLAAHIVAPYAEYLRALTKTSCSSGPHHKETAASNVTRFHKDLSAFVNYLLQHNPFKKRNNEELVNIATGVIANDQVNTDDAFSIGQTIQESMSGKALKDVTLKRKEQVVTFAAMRKPVRIDDQKVHISSAELQRRLISLAYRKGLPDRNIFKYELAPVAPSLFYDDGTMRKTNKSQLQKHLLNIDPSVVMPTVSDAAAIIIDGCALIHKLSWPKFGLLKLVCDMIVSCVSNKSDDSEKVCIVFDNYSVVSTKEPEQKRRRKSGFEAAQVDLNESTPIPQNKESFLANLRNKQNFIDLVSRAIKKKGITVSSAGEEGDADTTIVKKALDYSRQYEVIVEADDTDILVLLLYHIPYGRSVYMKTRSTTISIKNLQEILGREMCLCLPFAHAMTGCDTTSAIYGVGKVKVLKLLSSSQVLRSQALEFGDPLTSVQNLQDIGQNVMSLMYSSNQQSKPLDELRYLYMVSCKYMSVERMPPTERACHFHILRVQHQVCTWQHLHTVLEKELYGFEVNDGSLVPIITDQPPAPEELLNNIRCSCKTGKHLCKNCSCKKQNLSCGFHCACGGQCLNPPVESLSSDDSSSDDDTD